MRALTLAFVLATVAGAACSSSPSGDGSVAGTGGAAGSDGGGAGGAGTGGAGTGGTGTGGMAGSGGSLGDAGDAAVVPNLCKLKCDSSDDCTSNANDVGMTCSVLGSCLGCWTDTTCVQILSEWLLPCTDDLDCIPMGPTYVCIEAYGTGRCAKPAPLNPAEPCAPPAPSESLEPQPSDASAKAANGPNVLRSAMSSPSTTE